MEISLIYIMGTLLSVFIRWTVSRFPYSGEGKTLMYGDVEGFRHWMEISTNLPIAEWFVNTSRNDLAYFGMDQPPLTAFHSKLCGYIAMWVNPAWVKFDTSKGYESYHFKLFMRYLVVVSDLLVFHTAVLTYYFYLNCSCDKVKAITAIATLLYPGLILLDHGHFQFNCINLGLVIWALVALDLGNYYIGAVAFALALNYNHLELYHAVPFTCYFIGKCIQFKSGSLGIITGLKLCLAVIATFTVCWIPFFFYNGFSLHMLGRMFPLERGMSEEKMANVWSSLSTFVKLKDVFSDVLVVSSVATFTCMVPSAWSVLRTPTVGQLKLALINSSLITLVVSLHVHDNSILMSTVIVCLIFHEHPLPSVWFLIISTFSMSPLLIKDGLTIPMYATMTIYLCIVLHAEVALDLKLLTKATKFPIATMFFRSAGGALVLTFAAGLVDPPQRYPNLHATLCAIYSCGHFLLFAVYFHWAQLQPSGGSDDKYQFVKKLPSDSADGKARFVLKGRLPSEGVCMKGFVTKKRN